MAELTREEKSFVVQMLARHYPPSEVRDAVKETYGKDTDLAQLARYNPLCKAGATLSEELQAEFARERAAYETGGQCEVIALKHFRFRELLDLYRRAKFQKNYALAGQFLMQAAKEEGGLFTNRREITDPQGKPIVPDEGARTEAAKELDAWRKQMTEQLDQALNPPE